MNCGAGGLWVAFVVQVGERRACVNNTGKTHACPMGRAPNGQGTEAALQAVRHDRLVALQATRIRPDTATVFVTSDL